MFISAVKLDILMALVSVDFTFQPQWLVGGSWTNYLDMQMFAAHVRAEKYMPHTFGLVGFFFFLTK